MCALCVIPYHMSFWMLFSFSLSTAFISLSVAEGVKSGDTKKALKRSNAPVNQRHKTTAEGQTERLGE